MIKNKNLDKPKELLNYALKFNLLFPTAEDFADFLNMPSILTNRFDRAKDLEQLVATCDRRIQSKKEVYEDLDDLCNAYDSTLEYYRCQISESLKILFNKNLQALTLLINLLNQHDLSLCDTYEGSKKDEIIKLYEGIRQWRQDGYTVDSEILFLFFLGLLPISSQKANTGKLVDRKQVFLQTKELLESFFEHNPLKTKNSDNTPIGYTNYIKSILHDLRNGNIHELGNSRLIDFVNTSLLGYYSYLDDDDILELEHQAIDNIIQVFNIDGIWRDVTENNYTDRFWIISYVPSIKGYSFTHFYGATTESPQFTTYSIQFLQNEDELQARILLPEFQFAIMKHILENDFHHFFVLKTDKIEKASFKSMSFLDDDMSEEKQHLFSLFHNHCFEKVPEQQEKLYTDMLDEESSRYVDFQDTHGDLMLFNTSIALTRDALYVRGMDIRTADKDVLYKINYYKGDEPILYELGKVRPHDNIFFSISFKEETAYITIDPMFKTIDLTKELFGENPQYDIEIIELTNELEELFPIGMPEGFYPTDE